MEVERIFFDDVSIDKIIKELLDAQIEKLIQKHSQYVNEITQDSSRDGKVS